VNNFDYYQLNNIINSSQVPSTLHTKNNATAAFYQRYLLEKAISVFDWKLPENWNKDYFLYVLYCMGYVGVVNTDKYGVIPQWGTISGYNLYYAPADFLLSNPLIGTKKYTIGEDCELIKLQGNYNGVMDLVGFYSGKLALLAEAIDVNLVNSKSSVVFFAKNKTAAAALKKMYDEISSGNPASVVDKDLLDENGNPTWLFFQQNLKQNYMVSDMLADMRKIENQFCTDLGLPNSNTEKRERLTDDEVNSNNTETYSRAAFWLERLQESCEKVNKMFGLSISVDWRFKPDESDNVNSGPVQLGRNNLR